MPYSYLALGDSYTIGEGLPLQQSFPYQTVQILRHAGHSFYAPEIIARTGWTTAELASALPGIDLLPAYDFVSLLIGVNNEYRGRSLSEYAEQFEELAEQALRYTGSHSAAQVFVLSIPDWSASPFAAGYLPDPAGRNRDVIAAEIDAFNNAAKNISSQKRLAFIDITAHSRLPLTSPADTADAFTADGLHPSGPVYSHWATLLAQHISAFIHPPSAK